MNFQKHKIGNFEGSSSNNTVKKYTISLSLIFSLAAIIFLIIGIAQAINSINFSVFLNLAGADLKKDAYDHTNFLILGTGGGVHDGADLTDSIIVASLDPNDGLVSMLSIPRDLFIKDDLVGDSKINQIYFSAKKYYGNSPEGLDHLKKKIEEIVGIPIHYYIKLDFKGFTEMIDAIGGIDVDVKEDLYDPFYPKDGTVDYETFSIKKGLQHLDGKTALKYARSRETTSDFSRADRQQKIIYAIKSQALNTKVLFNKEKIENILNVLKENIETNIKVKEILTLGSYADKINSNSILHRLIHDDPTQCGGLLYTPERQYYYGMFVLIPAGINGGKDGISYIQDYADLTFNYQKIAQENKNIQILNGTKAGGIATEAKQVLNRFCFNVTRYGNAKNQTIEKTTYYYKDKEKRPNTLDFLQKMIPGEESTEIPLEYADSTADIIIELGKDYLSPTSYLKDPFYYLPAIKVTAPTETEATPTDTPAAPAPQTNTNPQ